MPSQRSPRHLRIPDLRPDARWRGAALLACAAVILSVTLACSSAEKAPPETPARVEPEPLAINAVDRPYLADPLEGYARAGESALEERVRQVWRRLLAEGDKSGAAEQAAEMLAAEPDFAPAQVLAAQVDFAEGEDRRVVERLLPVGDAQANYTAAQLLLGRASERQGDVALAYSSFRAIAARSAVALKRAGELHPRAMEIVGNRLREAVEQGRVEEAERHLALLRAWAPSEVTTLEGAARVAVAKGDRSAELAAVKELSQRRPPDRPLLERRAELELEVGDPGAGLKIVQDLASRNPEDTGLAAKLEHAKFRWRLSQLPQAVQRIAMQPEIDKADLAILLYWLVPDVRNSRPTGGRIATDILDHAGREEIVRVVNLGLMEVDSTLHRFFPGSPVRRSYALRVLQRVVVRFAAEACDGGAGLASPCDFAVQCGLAASPEECQGSGATSGAEAVELIRRALVLMGSF